MPLPREALTNEEIKLKLTALPGWQMSEHSIWKEYSFGSYAAGFLFASGVAQIAESIDHHPEIFITFGMVRVTTWTHTCGGVSTLDFELAKRIEAVVRVE